MRNATRLFLVALECDLIPSATSSSAESDAYQPARTAHAARAEVAPMITGFANSPVALAITSFDEAISCLKDYFACNWETGTFAGTNPLVYWPVTLRHPTPIHAMQTFVAAMLQKVGAEVVLCLDDLGNQQYRSDSFFSIIRRWWRKVNDSGQLGETCFSEISATALSSTHGRRCKPGLEVTIGFFKC